MAHTCNLNCSYCFASQGKYHGERALMSFEVGKRALDFLVENSGSRTNLEVDFFGGEPLMNWDEMCIRDSAVRVTNYVGHVVLGVQSVRLLRPDRVSGPHRRDNRLIPAVSVPDEHEGGECVNGKAQIILAVYFHYAQVIVS